MNEKENNVSKLRDAVKVVLTEKVLSVNTMWKKKNRISALAEWLSCLEHHLIHPKVEGSIPG